MAEADLYPALKKHFEALGYRVYAEVPAPHGGYVDLLAVQQQVTLAVELKLCFSRDVVRQARRNKRFVWESYVAVPEGARLPPRRRAALKRHGAGLLAVAESGVRTQMEARRSAPPVTVREAFGPHLEGELAGLYAGAQGGVPSTQRVSAFSALVEKVEAILEGSGGVANTDQILDGTLPWNYFRSKRAGLRWILENRFTKLDDDLWAIPRARSLRRPVRHQLSPESLVRTNLPGTYVCLPAPQSLPRPGDLLDLIKDGKLERRMRVISAERHPIVETAQRELRAGPAFFFRWRLRGEIQLPAETLVLRLGAAVIE